MLAQKKIVLIPCLIKDFQEVYVFSVLREKDNDIMIAMRRILIKIKGKHLLSTYLLTRQSDALCILSNLVPTAILWGRVLLLLFLYLWRNWNFKKSVYFPQIFQIVNGRESSHLSLLYSQGLIHKLKKVQRIRDKQ